MIMACRGTADANGASVRLYEVNEVLPTNLDWQKKLADSFLEMGVAVRVEDGEFAEEFKAVQRRGRPRKE
jgi:hypothetical protein